MYIDTNTAELYLNIYWASISTFVIIIINMGAFQNILKSSSVFYSCSYSLLYKISHQTYLLFQSTFSLGFMKDGQLHVSSAVSLSEEDDSGHYLPRIEGLLYRQGHTPVSIYMRTDTMAVPAMTVAPSTTMVGICVYILLFYPFNISQCFTL